MVVAFLGHLLGPVNLLQVIRNFKLTQVDLTKFYCTIYDETIMSKSSVISFHVSVTIPSDLAYVENGKTEAVKNSEENFCYNPSLLDTLKCLPCTPD